MGKALYRTYRSKKLAEIVGQEHITETLDNALKKGLISHAYLFTGPRGVGKTSIARILAHEINNLPYTDEQTHLDIIEIDAASNRRIDEIRDLRDKVHNAPASAKFKVYIIDEVHMLTREAFNALLKTLEEPPAHVVFILATTEIHKLPETIISRTQRFAFRPVEQAKVIAHLQHIAKQEKITVDDEALALIAAHGEGSFRDSISLLDQAGSTGTSITKATVEQMLGIAPAEHIAALVHALQNHDSQAAVQTIRQFAEQGSSAALIAKQLGKQLRNELIHGTIHKDETIIILEKLLEVPSSSNPFVFLEIILLDATLMNTTPVWPERPAPPTSASGSGKSKKASADAIPQKAPVEKPAVTKGVATGKQTISATDTTGTEALEDETEAPTNGATIDIASWNQVLVNIKAEHNTLYSILRAAEPSFSPGTITLAFGFAFHQKRINAKQNKQIIAGLIKSITGEDIIIRCIMGIKKATSDVPTLPPAALGEQVHNVPASTSEIASQANETTPDAPEDYYAKQADAEASARPLTAISNIFGGGELLES